MNINRRQFVAGAVVGGIAVAGQAPAIARTNTKANFPSLSESPSPLSQRVFKTLKIGMVQTGRTLTEKFSVAKAAGFAAIELDAPLHFTNKEASVASVKQAIVDSGLPVDGTVCGSHWKKTHSSPKPEIRQQALADLVQAIEHTAAIGGKTVLLVVGHGRDGSVAEVNRRSIDNITQALPVAAKHGITIAVENVWNRMHYDHEGPATQTAERLIQFVDAFQSPWVGVQFDVGNHWKYGSMGDWIRQLGKRIVKLDLKGFSRQEDRFTNIGDGDVDWADVRKALEEINFYGYAAAEVKGGDAGRLAEISTNVDRVLGLNR